MQDGFIDSNGYSIARYDYDDEDWVEHVVEPNRRTSDEERYHRRVDRVFGTIIYFLLNIMVVNWATGNWPDFSLVGGLLMLSSMAIVAIGTLLVGGFLAFMLFVVVGSIIAAIRWLNGDENCWDHME